MIVEPLQKAFPAIEHMSFESWTSILLAAVAVLLAIVTLIVAISGIGIALVGIWGLKALRKSAEQRAHDAVKQTIDRYPNAAEFIEVHEQMKELYRLMQLRMAEFKQEFDVLHQRSETANAILDRLDTKRNPEASNPIENVAQTVDSVVEQVSESYPGEEVNSNDNNSGEPHAEKTDTPSDAR